MAILALLCFLAWPVVAAVEEAGEPVQPPDIPERLEPPPPRPRYFLLVRVGEGEAPLRVPALDVVRDGDDPHLLHYRDLDGEEWSVREDELVDVELAPRPRPKYYLVLKPRGDMHVKPRIPALEVTTDPRDPSRWRYLGTNEAYHSIPKARILEVVPVEEEAASRSRPAAGDGRGKETQGDAGPREPRGGAGASGEQGDARAVDPEGDPGGGEPAGDAGVSGSRGDGGASGSRGDGVPPEP